MITLEGDLCLSTVDQIDRLRPKISTMLPPRVVIDLHDLKFIDSSGIQMLLQINALVNNLDGLVVLIRGPESIMKAFSIAGLDGIFEFADREVEEEGMANLDSRADGTVE